MPITFSFDVTPPLPQLLTFCHLAPKFEWDKRHSSQEHCDFLIMPVVLCMTVLCVSHYIRVFELDWSLQAYFTDKKTEPKET